MIRFFVIASTFLLLILFSYPDAVRAEDSVLRPVEPILNSAIDDVIEQRYDAAFLRADTIAQIGHVPEAWTLRALILQAWIIDYESFNRVDEFNAACDSAENRMSGLRSSAPGYAYLSFGLVSSFRATIAMRQEKWITAMRASMAMKSELEDALAADSSLTDSYVGLGSFDYWSSRKLRFLPFFGDNRERGIRNIKRALHFSRINTASAATALIWIYIDRGDNALALAMAKDELSKYPEARSFLWAAAEAAYAMGDWKNGMAYYQQILASVRSDPNQNNHFNELGCYHRLASMSVKTGDTTAALGYVNKGLSMRLTPDIRDRKKKDLADFNRWLKEWSGTTNRE